MTLKIYNTMTRTLEEFIPGGVKRDKIEDYAPVSIYSCGPTVYSYAHIGNFRTFVFNDFFRRYLEFRGYKLNQSMNITDVDDKTIAGANRDGVTLGEYTGKYTGIFFEDLKSLNIEEVEHYPRATESIDSMIDILEKINSKGLLYEKEGSLYFSISKYGDYGRLSRVDAREIKSGARYDADEYEKDDVRDFALWKASKKDEPSWETPFGSGRPGWHIECSAMIRKIYNSTIDVHTGGVDLIFPHHENEIAQSEAAYGEKFSRYWIHVEHLLVNGSKMSKSAGNFYTLRDLIEKGFSARSIRFLLLTAHYRKQLNFTLDGLKQAEQALERIDNFIVRLNDVKNFSCENNADSVIENFMESFTDTVDADLNISGGIGVFFDFITKLNSLIDENRLSLNDIDSINSTLELADSVFGFIYMDKQELQVDEEMINALVQERNDAKASKNFARADEIRDTLIDMGIVLEDTKDGTRWKIKK